MLVKNIYFVYEVEKNNKRRAFYHKTNGGINFTCVYSDLIKHEQKQYNCEVVNLVFCPSYKKAEQLSDFWNECYKKNNSILSINDYIGY